MRGKPVTLWYKRVNGEFIHNHIEDGHSEKSKPEPKFDSQKSWLKDEWIAIYGYLEGNEIRKL